ncbi:MAG: DNA methyltransferase [Candidatus Pacearchaeota archaeon]
MKQFFILGRNPELSKTEIEFYLKYRNIDFKQIIYDKNILILELNKELNIQDFGGVIKSGLIEYIGNERNFINYLNGKELINSNKFSYGIFGQDENSIFKNYFKSHKQKAILKYGRHKLNFQNNDELNLPRADYYFLYYKFQNNYYFGKINQEYDYSLVKKRDMQKPIRREELAISPRLAKILINLSGAKRNNLLLDPFCGVGGILQEALLMDINVFGNDINREAINYSFQNLSWLSKEFIIKRKYILERRNALNIPNKRFDAIATETPLGDLLKKKPNDEKAKKIIHDFEKFIIPILKHLKEIKKQNANISITFPKINKFRVNYSKIIKETSLKKLIEPVEESRPNQFISREIIILN